MLSVTLQLNGAQTIAPGQNVNVSNDYQGFAQKTARDQVEMSVDVDPSNLSVLPPCRIVTGFIRRRLKIWTSIQLVSIGVRTVARTGARLRLDRVALPIPSNLGYEGMIHLLHLIGTVRYTSRM
jgi:hypothetical protein